MNQIRRAVCLGAITITIGCSSNPPTPSPQTSATVAPLPPVVVPSPYENLLVRRPGKSIEDGKVYVVQNGKKHWVVNASWFAVNGYKFPDQVREIAATDLAAIPDGDPIQ